MISLKIVFIYREINFILSFLKHYIKWLGQKLYWKVTYETEVVNKQVGSETLQTFA